MNTRILIITRTEEMKEEVIKYLDENIDPRMIDQKILKPYFRICTKAGNSYRVWCNPNECTMCGVTVDLMYLDSSLPLSCLERYRLLVYDCNILNIRLVDKLENIYVRVEDRKW